MRLPNAGRATRGLAVRLAAADAKTCDGVDPLDPGEGLGAIP